MNDPNVIEAWAQRAVAALRIVAGYLFVQYGTAKLFGFPHVAMFDHLSLLSLIGWAGVIELVGGALMLVGLFVRPVRSPVRAPGASMRQDGQVKSRPGWRMSYRR